MALVNTYVGITNEGSTLEGDNKTRKGSKNDTNIRAKGKSGLAQYHVKKPTGHLR